MKTFRIFYHASAYVGDIDLEKDESIIISASDLKSCQRIAVRRARKAGIIDKDDNFKSEWNNYRKVTGERFSIKPISLGCRGFAGGLCVYGI